MYCKYLYFKVWPENHLNGELLNPFLRKIPSTCPEQNYRMCVCVCTCFCWYVMNKYIFIFLLVTVQLDSISLVNVYIVLGINMALI